MTGMPETGAPTQPATNWRVAALVGALGGIYMVSQFSRNSVGVIAPTLSREIGLTAGDLGLISSAFFIAFALVQIPLGVMIDRLGPKRAMLGFGVLAVLGSLAFAAAWSKTSLVGARVLLGVGCASFLMAPMAIFARWFSARRFSTMVGVQLGFGGLGTLAATSPLAWSTAHFGWRASFVAVAVFTATATALVLLFVNDEPPGRPASARRSGETLGQSFRGIAETFSVRSVWPLFLIHFASASTFICLVGLWGGPYLADIYGYGIETRGHFLFLLAIGQVIGVFAWGPADRLFGSYRGPVMLGGAVSVAMLVGLALIGRLPPAALAVFMFVYGFMLAFVPVMMAHGKALFPPHLVGRGITLLNLGTMGGVFVMQAITGYIVDLFPAAAGAYPVEAYRAAFLTQAALLAAATLIYRGAHDPYARA